MNERLKQLKNILMVFPSVRDIIRDIKLDYLKTSDGYFGELQINYNYNALDMAVELRKRTQYREDYDKVPFKDRSPFGKLDFIIEIFSIGNSFMVDTFQPTEISTDHLSMFVDFQPAGISRSIRIDKNQLTRSIPEDQEMKNKDFSIMAHIGNEFVELIDETLELSGESLKLFLRVRHGMVEE